MAQEKDKLIARKARLHPGLVLAYSLFVSFLVLIGIIWAIKIHGEINGSYALLQRDARKIELAERMQTAILLRLAHLHEAFASSDPFERDALIQQLYGLAGEYRQARDELLHLMDTAEERDLLRQLDAAARQAEPATNEVANLIQSDASPRRIRKALVAARQVRTRMIALLGRLVDLEQQLNSQAISRGQTQLEHFRRFTLVTGALLILFSLLLALMTRRTLQSHQRSMAIEALTDPLTELPNRRCVLDQINEAIESARNQHRHHVLMYMDLNRFKPINDHCGHEAGDRVLRMLARLWSGKLRHTDLLGRMGGDEFVALIRDADVAAARRIATDLVLLTEQQEFTCKGRRFPLGVSIGLAPITAETRDVRSVLHEADSACYQAKADQSDSIRLARPAIGSQPRQGR